VSLSIAQLVVIGTCAVLAAISAAAIPSAGLVTMVMVMQVNLYLGHWRFCPLWCMLSCDFSKLGMSAVCCLVCVCRQFNASVYTLWMHPTDSHTEKTVMYICPVITIRSKFDADECLDKVLLVAGSKFRGILGRHRHNLRT